MPGPVQSIERAAAILGLLAGGSRQLGLADIAGSLGLAKGTAHGILRTLEHVGFVEQDEASRKYQLGGALLHLSRSHLDVNDLRSHAINWADPLAARTGEAVRLGTLSDGRVLVVHHVFRPDDTLQTLDAGSFLPAHATALGKVLLAYDAGAAALLVRAGLDAYTRRTLVQRQTLTAELGLVREQGWAADVEECEMGQAGIAAAIRGPGGLVVGSIGISGAVEHVCDSRRTPRAPLVTFVREAARAVSKDLGAARW